MGERSLNVLLVHVWYWPHVGGGNQHVEHIARQLVARGHRATVWCADLPEHTERRFTRGGVDVHRLPPRLVLGGIDPVVSVRGLDLPFDVVHLHDTLPVLIRRTLKRARRSNIPVVTTFHNDYEKHGLIGRSLKAARWVLQGRRTLHASDARIALTPFFRDHLQQRGVRGAIEVIPNGFEPVEVISERPDGLAAPAEERPLYVFLGRLSEQKGLDLLLDAWDLCVEGSDFDADLAIAGAGGLEGWLHDRIARSEDPSSVHALGRVSDGEKRWLLEQAHAVLIPSRFEGLPTVLLEAMHAQTPVLMRDVNDLGRLVREADVGVSVPPADATVIAEGIRTLHDAPQGELERLGSNGATVAADYRWGAVTDRIIEVYRGVLR